METSSSGRHEAFSSIDYARNLGFTDEQYEEAVRRVKSADLANQVSLKMPQDANQLLMALIEVSCNRDGSDNKESRCDVQQCETSSSSASTSGCSSTPAFPLASTATSPSNQSLESLIGQRQASTLNLTQSDGLKAANGPASSKKLRRIYVDGPNVARTHDLNARFSWPGIRICVDWFRQRGHEVKVFVPEDKCFAPLNEVDEQALSYLDQHGILIRTPVGCNDDMFIIKAARQKDGIIVSNDHYRDECRRFGSSDDLDRFIYLNTLRYVFDDDTFIPAEDPRGRSGPKLEDFLQFQPGREKQDLHEYLHRMRAQPSRSLPNRLHPIIMEERTNQPPVERLIPVTQSGQRLPPDRSTWSHSTGYPINHHSRTKPQNSVGQHKVARFQVGRTKSHNF